MPMFLPSPGAADPLLDIEATRADEERRKPENWTLSSLYFENGGRGDERN